MKPLPDLIDPVMDAKLLQKANQLTDQTGYEILQADHHLHVRQARGHGRAQPCELRIYRIKITLLVLVLSSLLFMDMDLYRDIL